MICTVSTPVVGDGSRDAEGNPVNPFRPKLIDDFPSVSTTGWANRYGIDSNPPLGRWIIVVSGSSEEFDAIDAHPDYQVLWSEE